VNNKLGLAFAASILTLGSVAVAQAQQAGPEPIWAWAYSTQPKAGDKPRVQNAPVNTVQPGENAEELMEKHTVAGSNATYSRLQIRDGHDVIDWFPGDHPPMPDIIRHGPASLMAERGRGCGSCHLPNGKGRPENAPPAGQPVEYTIQQLKDMAAGLRKSSDPRKPNSPTMNSLAASMTEEEMREAAEYFAAIPWTHWMNVVEADKIPAVHLEEGNMFITDGEEPTEPLNGRIVETPIDEHQANYLRNPRSAWNVYVPVGSLARGENFVTTGGGTTLQCTICHGQDLMGLGNVPGIAGRSPSYMMRQLYDIKVGNRNGPNAALMKPVVANLSNEEMRDIVGYLASIEVPPMPGGHH